MESRIAEVVEQDNQAVEVTLVAAAESLILPQNERGEANKEKKKNNDERLISLKKARKSSNITSKNIHNIDVKA